MKKYVRCKVCGFVMEEKDLKDVCPACGVPKTAFVEHKYNVNEKRLQILSMHIHPISVHFPEAIAVFLFGFLILSLITPSGFSANLMITNRILAIFFPLAVIIASISGIYDGKVRFKKLSPPYLRIKIYLGIALFVFSLITTYLFVSDYISTTGTAITFIVLIINLILSVILGKMGGRLIDSVMPG